MENKFTCYLRQLILAVNLSISGFTEKFVSGCVCEGISWEEYPRGKEQLPESAIRSYSNPHLKRSEAKAVSEMMVSCHQNSASAAFECGLEPATLQEPSRFQYWIETTEPSSYMDQDNIRFSPSSLCSHRWTIQPVLCNI